VFIFSLIFPTLNCNRNIARWARIHGVKTLVSASSAAIYGYPDEFPLNEYSAKRPASVYAETKLEMENIMEVRRELCYSLQNKVSIILNMFALI